MLRSLMALFCLTLLCLPAVSRAQQGPFLPGDVIPAMQLPVPGNPAHAEYLGLQPEKQIFALSDIAAEAVIVEVFSMYCPICQKEAVKVNELFTALQARGLDDKIKILGLGAGNSELEVEVFREKYAIPFPLVPDPDYVLHKFFRSVGTPYFMILTQDPKQGQMVVRLSRLGAFEFTDIFLEEILEAIAGQ